MRLSVVAAIAVALFACSDVALARPATSGCLVFCGHRAAASELGARRPPGCPHAWCGCWLMRHLGLSDGRLVRARAWAGVGSNADGPGAGVIAVWPHHVGLILAAVASGRILVLSGNDGNAVRQRERSTRGIIAYRKL